MNLRKKTATLLALATPVIPAHAWASNLDGGPSTVMLALRATASLAVVLALLFGLVHLLRRSQRPSNATSKAVGLMTRGRLDLGARREIRLVEVEGRLLVVGITNERMELLTEMPAPNVVVSVDGVPDPARAAVRSPFAGVGGFLQKLTTSF